METQAGIPEKILRQLLLFQKNEITEYHVYRSLARTVSEPRNREVLQKIADDELGHYRQWKGYTGQDVPPDRLKVFFYAAAGRLLGITFAIKLMEKGENAAQDIYLDLQDTVSDAAAIARDEHEHEDMLIGMLDEKHLRYTGSIVLGLNDALVELTGALAGLTLALRNTRLIALTGLITGIAAALSMAASEYLSTKSENTDRQPLRASIYTGIAYSATVILLILPYLLLTNYYVCLLCTLLAAALIIACFTYYTSVAQDQPFTGRFIEMSVLSFGVAAISFCIGYVLRAFMGVEV